MSAKIEVRNALHVSGRGAVLIGFVRAGTVQVGQVTGLLQLGRGPQRRLEVAAIQQLASAEVGGSAIGLVFRNPPNFQELQTALPRGALLTLEAEGGGVMDPSAGG